LVSSTGAATGSQQVNYVIPTSPAVQEEAFEGWFIQRARLFS
jgi:hypothetical protein